MKDELETMMDGSNDHDHACSPSSIVSANWNAALARHSQTVARELHDDLAQVLTALRMNISLFKLRHCDNAQLVDDADAMLQLTDRCMHSLCNLIDDLQVVVPEQSVALAIQRLCTHFEKHYKLDCELSMSGDFQDLKPYLLLLLRILYEALKNIAIHAGSCKAFIKCHRTQSSGLHLEIRDSGGGFDPDQAKDTQGLGLLLVRDCARALGGVLEIVSPKGGGTSIILRIPEPRSTFAE